MANDFNGVFWAKQADFRQNFRTLSYDDSSFDSYLRVDDHDEFDELNGLEFLDGLTGLFDLTFDGFSGLLDLDSMNLQVYSTSLRR